MGLITCWNNKSISESKRVPFLLNGKHVAVSRIQLRLIGLFVAAADSGELVSWLNTATWWLLGEIKEGVRRRSTLEIAININWRALPPAGSLNNSCTTAIPTYQKVLGFFAARVRASGNVMISFGL